MACCGGVSPISPEGVVAAIEDAKDKVGEVMDDMGDKFSKLSEELSEGISMEPVTNMMEKMVGDFRELADNPGKVLGAAGVCACCLPLATIKETIGELAETITKVGSGFGALEKIMKYVNIMIEGLSGIGEKISQTVSALGDLPDVLDTVKDALTGGGDKAAASDRIDQFLEAAGLKAAGDALSGVLKPIESISNSKELDDIMEMISSLAKFIMEAPGKLKSMIPPIPCLPIPAPITMLISGIEGFSGMFDSAAIEKVLSMAKGQKGVSASSVTGPITSLESSLQSAKMALKLAK